MFFFKSNTFIVYTTFSLVSFFKQITYIYQSSSFISHLYFHPQVSYKVNADNTLIHSQSINGTNHTIRHLKEGTSYKIWVTAGTRLGMGPPSKLTVSTENDGTYYVHSIS